MHSSLIQLTHASCPLAAHLSYHALLSRPNMHRKRQAERGQNGIGIVQI
jgi:hypothetical protein